MTCVHLRELFDLCKKSDIKFSSSDLIRIVCPECGEKETCPSEHLVVIDESLKPSQTAES